MYNYVFEQQLFLSRGELKFLINYQMKLFELNIHFNKTIDGTLIIYVI